MRFDFEKLEIYQKALLFANDTYNLSKKFPKEEQFGITSQLRRASLSISLNIAEGSGRSKKEFRHFLIIARTSVHECVPILRILKLQNYISEKEENSYYAKCVELAKMICGLINKL